MGQVGCRVSACEGRQHTLKVFVNTVLGEPWREQADEVDEAALAARAESFDLDHIPPEVLGGDRWR